MLRALLDGISMYLYLPISLNLTIYINYCKDIFLDLSRSLLRSTHMHLWGRGEVGGACVCYVSHSLCCVR